MVKRDWKNFSAYALRHKDQTPACRNARWSYVKTAGGAEAISCANCGAILAISCSVMGCNHTRGVHKGERPLTVRDWWVCGEHWGAVPRWMRAIVSRARRRARRLDTPGSWAALARLQQRARRAAIEQAMGVGG